MKQKRQTAQKLTEKKKKPTLKDIAEASGVSIATVSFVFSGKGNISKEMSNKILSIANELGYKRQKKQYQEAASISTLAILTYVNQEWAYAWNIVTPIINAIEKNNTAKGYATVIIPVKSTEESDLILKNILNAKVCGVYSIHYTDVELFQTLQNFNIPVLVINNSKLLNTICTVCSDDFQGAYEGTKHLIEIGHKNIIYFDYNREGQESVLSDRFIGFKKAMQEEFEKKSLVHITTDLFDIETARKELTYYLNREPIPTAVFAHDDRLAEIIINLLSDLGYSIPNDISIIAPGEVLDYSCPITPRITTMSIQTTVLGSIASEKMFNLVEKHIMDIHGLKVSQKLIDRGSCTAIIK